MAPYSVSLETRIISRHNVWVGAGVSTVPGVTIGDNTVIGAGSVVPKDLAANVLAVGNPCEAIREIPKPRIP